jgi:hypothetical protein
MGTKIDSVLTLRDGSWRFFIVSAVCAKPSVAYVHSQKSVFWRIDVYCVDVSGRMCVYVRVSIGQKNWPTVGQCQIDQRGYERLSINGRKHHQGIILSPHVITYLHPFSPFLIIAIRAHSYSHTERPSSRRCLSRSTLTPLSFPFHCLLTM